MAYYNTNKLAEAELKQAIANNKSQNELILDFFKARRTEAFNSFSPESVLYWSGLRFRDVPITSIRRALSDLTKNGDLIKTSEMTSGDYGKPVHKWTLNTEKHPLP